MEILRFFKPRQKKQFVSESDFILNQDKQFRTATESLVSLRDAEIEEEDELKIDYFFYTDDLEKSQKLEKEIQKIGYIVNHGPAIQNKNLFVITGRTTKMKMMHETLRKWIREMSELGYKYDCSFDSWKITPEQH
jgi:hypothetical protein